MGWGGVGGGVRADVLWRRRRGRRQDVPGLVSGKGRCRADTHNTVTATVAAAAAYADAVFLRGD